MQVALSRIRGGNGFRSWGLARFISDSAEELKMKAKAKKKKNPFVESAVKKLDRALQMNNGKERPEWDDKPCSVDSAVDKLVRGVSSGSMEKDLADVLRDSTGIAARVIGRLSRPEKAMDFFIWAAKQNGFRHDASSCNQLLDTLVRAKKTSEAYGLFIKRFSRMHEPDASSYSILMRGLCDSGLLTEACEIFNEMHKRGIRTPEGFVGSLLASLAAGGKVADAMAYYQILRDSGSLDSSAFSSVLNALSGRGMIDEAIQVMQDMVHRKISPDFETVRAYVEFLCRYHRAMDARRLLSRLPEVRNNTVLVTFIMEKLCESGSLSEAMEMFEEMSSRDLVSYSVAVDGFYRARRFDRAFELMERMVRERSSLPDASAFKMMVDEHYLMRREDEGVVRRRPTVAMYTLLIFGLCRSSRVDEALMLYGRMLSGRAGGGAPDSLTFTVMIGGLGLAGRGMEAENVFRDMIQRNVSPHTVTYNALVFGLCKAGAVDRAVELVLEMPERGCERDSKTLKVLVDGLRRAGRVDDARKVEELGVEALGTSGTESLEELGVEALRTSGTTESPRVEGAHSVQEMKALEPMGKDLGS